MSIILGINVFHADASATLVIDGIPVVAIPEERLNRVKHYARFPTEAIRHCFDIAGIRWRDVDAIALGHDAAANRTEKVKYVLGHPSKLLNLAKIQSARSAMDNVKDLIARECEVDPSELRFSQHNIEHHLAHMASAYFISEWDKAAGITIDGSGDFVTCMMSECEGDEIRIKRRIYVPHSIGSLYTMICEFIGYDKYGDEGKVMGLAPLGKDTYHDRFDDMVELTAEGFRLNPAYFLPFGSNQGLTITPEGEMVIHRHYSDLMVDIFGEQRARYGELTERDKDLACGLQRVFDKVYLHLLRLLHELVPQERVVMAGGCTLNSVANGKIFDETLFRQTCIQPAAGDEGLALGAALYVSNSIFREGNRWVMRDAYLGPEYSEQQIRAVLEDRSVPYIRLEREDLIRKTVDELVKGNVVGWFQGRMEWGPRALGNRSILAHPGFPGMKEILNARIKHREPFRPFAPTVLADRQAGFFEHTHPSPFMLHVYKIRPKWRNRLSAVNHVDSTGRLQSLTRDENPLYYDLIEAFEAQTGLPVLLNTSFNENEPIVQHPREAIDCFLRTKMDILAIGPFFCQASDVKPV